MNGWLAGLLAFVFFAPLAFIYARSFAGRLQAAALARGRSVVATAAPKLVWPAVLGCALALRLSGPDLPEWQLAAGSRTLATGLSVLWFLGSLAAILFFVVIPFVMGRLLGTLFACMGKFAATRDDPLSFGARGFTREGFGEDGTESTQMGFTVAIDGPAAAGKGTIAKRLAAHYGFAYLDTGLLYRAIGRLASQRGLDLDDGAAMGTVALALDPAVLDDGSLRGREAGELASRVAVHAPVRAALTEFQRGFARRPGGAVLDGRDIGTVICPEAEAKIFVTASPEVRARRRTDELHAKGRAVDYETILDEVLARDRRDTGRATAPLRAAPDAALLDTSELDIEEAFQAACRIVDASLHRRNGA